MKNLHEFLQQIKTPEQKAGAEEAISISAMTAPEIHQRLKHFLGDGVHLIDPALSLQASPLSTGPAQGGAVFNHAQAIRKLCLTPDQKMVFTKPIVMVLAEPKLSVENKALSSRVVPQVAAVWKTVVILPVQYQPPEGKAIGNAQPLFLYFDPQIFQHTTMPGPPAQFGLALCQGCQLPAIVQGRQVVIRMEPMLPRPIFSNGSRKLCADAATSGWWAIYFALMAVGTGQYDFDSICAPGSLSLARLQQLLAVDAAAPVLVQASVAAPMSSSSSSSSSLSSVMTSAQSRHSRFRGNDGLNSSSSSFSSSASGSDDNKEIAPDSTSLTTAASAGSLYSYATPEESTSSSSARAGSLYTATTPADAAPSLSFPRKRESIPAPISVPHEGREQNDMFNDAEGIGGDDKESKESKTPQESAPVSSASAEQKTLPAYSPETQIAILRAYGISEGAQTVTSRDSTSHFHVYFYRPQAWYKDILLKDLADYWRTQQQGKIQNRRVAFLLEPTGPDARPLAVVAQFIHAPATSAQSLWLPKSDKSSSQLLTDEKWVAQAKTWHHNLQLTVLGVDKDHTLAKALLPKLQESIKQVVNQGQIAINFKDIALSSDASIVLTHDILTMLSLARTEPKDVVAADREHRTRCVQTLLRQLSGFALQNSSLYQTLVEDFRRVTKFNLLIAQRKNNYGLTGNAPETLAALKTRDQQAKPFIYAQPLGEIGAMLQQFSWPEFTEFLAAKEIPGWLAVLSQQKQTARLAIVAWEQELEEKIEAKDAKQDRCAYYTDKAKAAAIFIYHCSWVSIGKEIFGGFAKMATADGAAGAAVAEITQRAADTTRQFVTTVTRSAPLAERSAAGVAAFLGEYPLSRSLGAGLGLGLQIYLGPLDLVRLVIVLGGAQWINQSLQTRRIREEKAEVVAAPMSPQAVLRGIQVLCSVVEAYAVGYSYPLIFAAGGIAGNVASTTLAKAVSPNLSSQSPENREERQSLLLMIALAGGQLGQYTFKAIYLVASSVQDRLTHRDVAFRLLSQMAENQPQLQSLRAEGPTFRYSPSLWFNNRNPIQIEWTMRDGARQTTQCDITTLPALTPQGIIGLVCNEPPPAEASSVLSLPSPGM